MTAQVHKSAKLRRETLNLVFIFALVVSFTKEARTSVFARCESLFCTFVDLYCYNCSVQNQAERGKTNAKAFYKNHQRKLEELVGYFR